MSFPFFRVWVGLSVCGFAAAQAHGPAPPTGTIAGMVVDAGNNSPIRRAVVTLSTVEAHPQDAVAWTDGNGRFAFGYLPPGRYELSVDKNGFQRTAYGADSPRRPPGTISLAAGEIRSDLVFRLQQVTTILGTVTDEQGDSLARISVSAMRWGWQRQKRQLLPGPATMTDSNGHYRLTGLQPGSYAVVASRPFGPPLPIQSESVAGETQRPYHYGTQYYPGTDRAESATLLSIEAGHEYPDIDFHLVARPVPQVRGKVVVPAGITNLEQISINASSRSLPGRGNFGAGVSQPDFTFRFDQLQPGSYTFEAQATAGGRRYRGTQSVEITSDGTPDISIVLQPSIDLIGTLVVEGPDAAKYPATSVSLVPGDGIPGNGPQLRASVNKDGTFTIRDVPPGVWDLNPGPVPPGGYIKSMRLGDQDVLTEEMSIDSSTQAPLKIVFSTKAAQVQGDVTRNGQPARAAVVLAPEQRYRHVMSFYRTVTADATGHFEIKNAAPGKYQLFAFDEFEPQSIQDPEFLKPFEQTGVAVTLREGENTPQALMLISTEGPAAGNSGGLQ
jgi:hypothetical protein